MEQTMIAKLVGTLDDFGSDWAVLDVQGVGYLVHCSARTLSSLGVRGDRAAVFTQMQVSDSDVRLIGFSSAAERDWFRILMQVQGVGSKVALAILSVLSAEELQRACAQSDSATVARANGVGPKLATRIVNELKDKAGALPAFGGGDGASGSTLSVGASGADAISALQNLGFKPNIASAAVAHALEELEDGADLNTIIRVALKKAAG